MMPRIESGLDGSGRLVSQGVAAAQRLRAMGADQTPAVLAFFPPARTNPFQALMYDRLWEQGIASVPVPSLEDLGEVGSLTALGIQAVFHIHWTSPVLAKVEGPEAAELAVDRFLLYLDQVLEVGGHVVWTLHNAMPHECEYPEAERRLRRGLAERCALIHVLCPDTPELVAPHFEVPEHKVVAIPHPNYTSAYANFIGRDEARAQLDLHPAATTYAFVGAIRPYKGVERLIDAFDLVLQRHGTGPPPRLIVAGKPHRGHEVEHIEHRLMTHPYAQPHFARIPETDMQLYVNAADAVVLPYAASLNSGVLMLALSFGRPVVAPRAGCLPNLVDDDVGVLFEPGDTASLSDAMGSVVELAARPDAERAIRDRAREFDPDEISRRFADEVRDVISSMQV